VIDLPPIIDMHTHVWGPSKQAEADANVLIEMANRFNLEAVVVIPLFGGLCPSPAEITAGNEAADGICRRDKRLKPMVTVYPRHGQLAVDEMNRWMDRAFVGLKIWVSRADEPCVFPLIERMIARDKPTLIHAMHKSVGCHPPQGWDCPSAQRRKPAPGRRHRLRRRRASVRRANVQFSVSLASPGRGRVPEVECGVLSR
jgi:predicted TIM-barrel fold metal-dependent hydrolase